MSVVALDFIFKGCSSNNFSDKQNVSSKLIEYSMDQKKLLRLRANRSSVTSNKEGAYLVSLIISQQLYQRKGR